MDIADFIDRITSRKFLLALGACIVLAANRQWGELVATVLGFAGINVAEKATVK